MPQDLVLKKSLELHDKLVNTVKKFYLSELKDNVTPLDATNITMAALSIFIPHIVSNLFNKDVPATIINHFIDKICAHAKDDVVSYKEFLGRIND